MVPIELVGIVALVTLGSTIEVALAFTVPAMMI